MATAIPFDLEPAFPPDYEPLSPLSDEDAADVAAFLAFCKAEDEREPGVIDLEIATARMYGNDFARENADIAAGRHPLQLFMQRQAQKPR